MALNGCSRDTSQRDLKALYKSGQLIRQGGPYVAIYALHRKEDTV
ncbi:MAG: hypothetical protein LUD02_13505 [Tannerellaceae bacterium]|nr:hypothetical protein [Tannerellaceae bacterium]MCD8265033.1 hypothetical protein [Tannerellaceae bacterium]